MARLSGFQWTHTGQVQHRFRRNIIVCLQFSILFYLPFSHSFLPCHFLRNSCLPSTICYIFLTSPSLYICYSLALCVFKILYFSSTTLSCHLPFSHRRSGYYICHSHIGGRAIIFAILTQEGDGHQCVWTDSRNPDSSSTHQVLTLNVVSFGGNI